MMLLDAVLYVVRVLSWCTLCAETERDFRIFKKKNLALRSTPMMFQSNRPWGEGEILNLVFHRTGNN